MLLKVLALVWPLPQEELTRIICFYIILPVFAIAFLHEFFNRWKFKKIIKNILKGLSKYKNIEYKVHLDEMSRCFNDIFGYVFSEFKESLFYNEEGKVFKTIESLYFFKYSILRPYNWLSLSIIEVVPGMLTALGILGTFLGLIDGIQGLGSNITHLDKQIGILTGGLKTAFKTSIWGIFFSILFNFFNGIFTGSRKKELSKLTHKLDWLFERKTEQALLNELPGTLNDILVEQKEQVGHLKSFTTDLSAAVSKAMVDSISEHLSPKIERMSNIVEEVAKHSIEKQGEGVEKMVENFVGSVNENMTNHFQELFDSTGEIVSANMQFKDDLYIMIKNLSEASASQHEIISAFRGSVENTQNLIQNFTPILNHLNHSMENLSKINSSTSEINSGFANTMENQKNIMSEVRETLHDITEERNNSSQSLLKFQNTFKSLMSESFEIAKSERESAQESLGEFKEGFQAVSQSFISQASTLSDTLSALTTYCEQSKNGLSTTVEHLTNITKEQGELYIKHKDASIEATKSLSQFQDVSSKMLETALKLEYITDKAETFSLKFSEFTQNNNELTENLVKMNQHIQNSISKLEEIWNSHIDAFKDINENLTRGMTGFSLEVKSSLEGNLKVFDKSLAEATGQLGTVVKDLEDTLDSLGEQLYRLRGDV